MDFAKLAAALALIGLHYCQYVINPPI